MTFAASTHAAVPMRSRQQPHDHNRLISEATVPHLTQHIHSAFRAAQRAVTDRLIYESMASGNLVHALQPVLGALNGGLQSSKIYLANAHLQARNVAASGIRVRKATVQFDLDALPQPTLDALDDYDFGLIRDVDDGTRGTISQVVNRGLQEGWSPGKMARSIRGSIGLTPTQEQAVNNFRTMLENGSPDALTRALRDARFDDTVQGAIDGVRALSPTQIDRMVGRYEDRYLALRANTIARYESLRASNQGSSDAIQEAIDNGDLDPERVYTTWMIANDELTCPACRSIVEIQPDGVPYGTPFQWAVQGKRAQRMGTVDLAPLHPDCRCTNSFRIDGDDE